MYFLIFIIFNIFASLLGMKQDVSQQPSTQISQYIKWANDQSYHQFNFIRYDTAKGKWVNYQFNQADSDRCLCLQQNSKLTTLTINVLTDSIGNIPLKRDILFSQERYHYILEYLKQVQPHVITLNEVTNNFYQMLTKCQWFRQRYWVSDVKHKHGIFNAISARIVPFASRKIKLNGLGCRILTGYFLVKCQDVYKLVSISCAHFISLTHNAGRRKNQLQELTQLLENDNISLDTTLKQNIIHIVQGDLNIHNQQQNAIFDKFGWKDSWIQRQQRTTTQIQKLKQNPGYTFDGQANHMIKQIYWGFEKRQMRLDRVIYKGFNIKCLTMEVILNRPVYSGNTQGKYKMGFFKGATSFIADLVGYSIFRSKEKYLFPSDHFGLLTSFNINKN